MWRDFLFKLSRTKRGSSSAGQPSDVASSSEGAVLGRRRGRRGRRDDDDYADSVSDSDVTNSRRGVRQFYNFHETTDGWASSLEASQASQESSLTEPGIMERRRVQSFPYYLIN